jgi:hypothetical protein
LRPNEQDDSLRARRNWVPESLDRGVVLEHVSFPVVILSGLLLLAAGGWTSASIWLVLKLAIVVTIFILMELYDYPISHFKGSKRVFRKRGDDAGYEQAIQTHRLFLLASAPLVAVFVVGVVFLAVTKPM